MLRMMVGYTPRGALAIARSLHETEAFHRVPHVGVEAISIL